MQIPETPQHSIRVISRLTGIPLETLRAWERRYGFPSPERRHGSNRRLYSEQDLEKLRWVQLALGDGYRPGDVIHKSVEDLRALTSRSLDATDTPQRTTPPEPNPVTPSASQATSGTSIEKLLHLIQLDKMIDFESQIRLFSSELGPIRFVVEIAHPLLVAVGESWEQGTLKIRQEHAATQVLSTQLRSLIGHYKDDQAKPVVLLTTLPGEQHHLGIKMVALYLAARGARPLLLGPSTPIPEIVEAARAFKADVVGLTVMASKQLTGERERIQELLLELPRKMRLWLGGSLADKVVQADKSVTIAKSWSAIDEALAQFRAADLPDSSEAPNRD